MRTRIVVGSAAVAALVVIAAAVWLFAPPRQIAGVSIAAAAGPPIIGGATYVTTTTTATPTSTTTSGATTTTTTTTAGKPSTTANVAQPPAARPPAAPPQQSSPNASGQITFYGAADNDPPGSREIAYPNVLHGQAGGTGTFDDPTTFAAQQGQFQPGTKIYVPDVKRYFILEDSCADCRGSHIDLWAGAATDRGIIRCEDSLTRNGSRPYQLNPPTGLPVSPGDLYSNGHCFHG
jgi:3D (Asp-Asp-Asp) domain-containing protein